MKMQNQHIGPEGRRTRQFLETSCFVCVLDKTEETRRLRPRAWWHATVTSDVRLVGFRRDEYWKNDEGYVSGWGVGRTRRQAFIAARKDLAGNLRCEAELVRLTIVEVEG